MFNFIVDSRPSDSAHSKTADESMGAGEEELKLGVCRSSFSEEVTALVC